MTSNREERASKAFLNYCRVEVEFSRDFAAVRAADIKYMLRLALLEMVDIPSYQSLDVDIIAFSENRGPEVSAQFHPPYGSSSFLSRSGVIYWQSIVSTTSYACPRSS